ncbi:hypothetical protein J8281_01790 [Aquimarina sp. U1-2]|uniref:hypothetical protein n=1 Tax=Aquimarina sp. U1-2 TaxID=2823141 RepID=UPI001AED0B46|nr:hypothetical protein [Aquimarina sp. U1-2]MBP2830904.1 hypothetical protein [Aquimarina sp. U1-2]
MKNFLIIVITCFMMSSCQEEERELIDPTIDTTISTNSTLAKLMKNVVIHDGSYDDIVDGGNCFSIDLPYILLVNGEPKTILQREDYNTIGSTDRIDIQFPVMVTFSDYQQATINSVKELEAISSQCEVDDEDIECIDFIYPIQISTFNTRSNSLSATLLNHDFDFFLFMSSIDENTSFSINYPIDLVLYTGESIDTQHNSGLQEAISKVVSACDENDE